MTELTGKTPDIAKENIAMLKEIFPDVFEEGKVDFDKLKQVLGDYVDDSAERYNFSWNGKGKALRLAQSPSTGTLRPCPEESKDWDTTQNLYIEGDNLEVLKLLQKSYHGKVKMIYIDPPYNTGGDFVYPDDYSDSMDNYLHITGQKGEGGAKISTNTEANGRYHTDWLNMMYPRLRLSRNLLAENGLIFISIDDNEVKNLRSICDEIYGSDNFIACVVWQKIHSTKNDAKYFSENHEYMIVYAKRINNIKIGLLQRTDEMNGRYKNPDDDPRGEWQSGDLVASGERKNGHYPVISPKTGKVFDVPQGKHWVYSEENMTQLVLENQLWFGVDGNSFPRKKRFLTDVQDGRTPNTIWLSEEVGHNQTATREVKQVFDDNDFFDFPKPVDYIKQAVLLSDLHTDEIILDFFSGSATTAHAVMKLNAEDGGNRKFIMVQFPESCDEKSEAFKAGYKNICEIGKERIRRAGEKIKTDITYPQAEKSGSVRIAHGVTGTRAINEEFSIKKAVVADQTFMNLETGEIDFEQLAVNDEKNKYRFNPDSLDIGFKVFKLDTSNVKKWNAEVAFEMTEEKQLQFSAEKLEEVLQNSVSNFVTGRTEMDVIYEIMIKMGLDLTYPVEETVIDGKTVYSIGLGVLMICLDDNITTVVAEGMVKLYKEKNPETWKVVFKDNGFSDDSAKTNVREILKCAGLDEDAFTTL